MAEQLTLFKDELPKRPPVRKPSGGSANPIVFRDYDSYVAKFIDKEKTTDDTYTPRDVFDAVVKYVGTVVDMKDKLILRPFYPGGDYENADYPENGVVIDNPPFSMFTKICAFYSAYGIPFFLFGPGLTIASCCKYCTAVIISEQITFDNGAKIKCNFASNLYGDTLITTAPLLDQLLKACPSQDTKVNLPKYEYPEEILSISDMQTICRGGIPFAVSRHDAAVVRDLDLHPKGGGLFGDHFLLSAAKAAAKASAINIIPIQLSPRERRIVERLGEKQSEFESFAQGYLKDNKEEIVDGYDRYEGLKVGAIWQKERLIKKAVAWLAEHNRRDFTDFDGLGGATFHKNRMLNAFRRAMMED